MIDELGTLLRLDLPGIGTMAPRQREHMVQSHLALAVITLVCVALLVLFGQVVWVFPLLMLSLSHLSALRASVHAYWVGWLTNDIEWRRNHGSRCYVD